jgi:polyhydroxybutyrate depolymerase
MSFVLCLIFALLAHIPAWACGVDTDCQIDDRTYRIYLPKRDANKPISAIFFAHGWRGTAAGVIHNKSLIALADELGVALVAPQSKDEDWQLPGRPRHTNNTGEEEFSYYERLVNEVVKRFSIDRSRLLMSGFSAGGMMTWNLACYEGKLFAGFAPIAGTFWAPIPKTCPGPVVDLIHFHGTSDKIVPIDGRIIADTKQGDVAEALSLFAERGGFGPAKPVSADGLECQGRENAEGKILEFCTYPGGHQYSAEYVRRAWELFKLADL